MATITKPFPLVNRIAKEHDIDSSLIKGTDLGGRITREDVLQAIEEAKKADEVASTRNMLCPTVLNSGYSESWNRIEK